MAQLVECKTWGRMVASSRLTGSFCVLEPDAVSIRESPSQFLNPIMPRMYTIYKY